MLEMRVYEKKTAERVAARLGRDDKVILLS
jgi:hypothetical protein